jgi:hypothetical protein
LDDGKIIEKFVFTITVNNIVEKEKKIDEIPSDVEKD